MKTIDVKTIEETVCSLAKEANFVLPNDIVEEIPDESIKEEIPSKEDNPLDEIPSVEEVNKKENIFIRIMKIIVNFILKIFKR